MYIDDTLVCTSTDTSWYEMWIGSVNAGYRPTNMYFDDWKVMVPETQG